LSDQHDKSSLNGNAGKGSLMLSIGLFVLACALPALVLHTGQHLNTKIWRWDGYESINGLSLLAVGLTWGWLRLNFTAFANLPLWLSWILYARGHFTAARVTSTIALILSLETLQLFVQPYWFDEAASREGYLAAPHIGFFCWVGSMFVILFASNRALCGRSSDLFAASNRDER
jgi:hypothetical protein